MRDRTMKLRRDRHVIKHRYFKHCHRHVNNHYELVEEVTEDEKDLVLIDLITEQCKDRRLLMLNLGKTYIRDYELSGNKKFYDASINILQEYIMCDKLELNIQQGVNDGEK